MIEKFEILPGRVAWPLKMGMSKNDVLGILGAPHKRYEIIDEDDETDEHFEYPDIPMEAVFFGMDSGQLSWVEFDRGAPLFWKSKNIFDIDRCDLLREMESLAGAPEYDKKADDDGTIWEESYRFPSLDLALHFGESGILEKVSSG